jgi:hypothetical protein
MPKEIISVPNSSARASSSQVWVSFSGERILSINKHYLFVNKDKLLFAKIAPEEVPGDRLRKNSRIQPNLLLCRKRKLHGSCVLWFPLRELCKFPLVAHC